MEKLSYEQLIEQKRIKPKLSGFEVEENALHGLLFDFQKYCTRLALRHGRYALFEDCGLGKTFQGSEWVTKITNHIQRPCISVAPLAVVDQTIQEGVRFGYDIREAKKGSDYPFQITNYEQLDNINPDDYGAIWLDESSILKNETGAYRNKLIKGFENHQFKLCTTATPSPNDPMELGNHSEFLNIMPYNEMLAMFFTHDGSDTSKWKIKGHAKQRFYEWVNSWAIMLSNPADIGFSATGYDLPALNFIEKQIKTPKRDNGKIFNDTAVSATNINSEFRLTVVPRLEMVKEIIDTKPGEAFSIWIKHKAEGESLRKLLPDAIEVSGEHKPEYKKKMLLAFGKDEFQFIITKSKIASFGLNWQNCHNAIAATVGFGFEEIYQLIRRHYRFGQKHDVNLWIITTDTMQNVIQSINKKIKNHIEMQKGMTKAHLKQMAIEKGEEPKEQMQSYKGKNFEVYRGNCVKLINNLADNSIGFSMFSPPFPTLYVYSNHDEDMGNNKDFNKFKQEFQYMVAPLFNKMQAGRNVVVHCQDLPIQKGKEGYIGLRDFSGMILDTFIDAGFIYHSRVTLWKNPVIEMTRTHALGLLHAQIKKDAGMSRVGLPDYLLVFRKPGEHENPVKHQDTDPNGPNFMNVDMWQKIASPVWFDVNFSETLNLKGSKDADDEAHICPLSLDTIGRATLLWSNPGDLCYTPFGGIGSEPFKWLEMGRKAIANELKESYFNIHIKNCKAQEVAVEAGKRQMLMFS
jgi:hypothetical protein